MKTIVAVICTAALSTACMGQEPAVTLQAEGRSGGPMYRWDIPHKRNLAQQRWMPTQGNPPLAVNKATDAALNWVKKKYPEVKEFAVASVQLKPAGFGQVPADRWFYRVEFNPVVGGRILFGGQFVAVILFDGSVVEPQAEQPSEK